MCFYPVMYPDRRHILKMLVLVDGATLQLNSFTICPLPPKSRPTVSKLPPQLDAIFYSSVPMSSHIAWTILIAQNMVYEFN